MALADPISATGTTGTKAQTTAPYQNHNEQLQKTSTQQMATTPNQTIGSRPVRPVAPTAPSNNAMVSNQITGLLAQNSPYIQQARLAAQRASAARGLNNSSMAVQSGEQAAISQALPIAQQDAGTHAQFEQNDQKYRQDWSMADQSYDHQTGLANLNADLADRRDANQHGYALEMADKNFGYQTQLSDQQYNQQLGVNDQQFGHQTSLNQQQNQHQLNMDNNQFKNQTAINDQQFGHQQTLNSQQNQQQKDMENLNHQNQLAMQNDTQLHQTDLQKLQGQQQMDLADLNAEHQQLLESNKSASSLYSSYQQAVAQIMSDPKMDPTKAKTAIETLKQSMDASLKLLSGISDIDLTGYSKGEYGGTSPGTGTSSGSGSSSGSTGSDPKPDPRDPETGHRR